MKKIHEPHIGKTGCPARCRILSLRNLALETVILACFHALPTSLTRRRRCLGFGRFMTEWTALGSMGWSLSLNGCPPLQSSHCRRAVLEDLTQLSAAQPTLDIDVDLGPRYCRGVRGRCMLRFCLFAISSPFLLRGRGEMLALDRDRTRPSGHRDCATAVAGLSPLRVGNRGLVVMAHLVELRHEMC